ncbi:hypothetical protein O7606_26165 [Micromonospora sp. WMMD882]|uniref:hypothetical protein n=1 Tax=Micromonospora sp. WMMD882 TaxID=3015151 RepID=UPI00248CC48C|nr:hypothetical protein [Micromonospora sp. WMMD882]WBB79591.1 hypothetical protein O7606_26165 [Micromonospora sp. WMMD882]
MTGPGREGGAGYAGAVAPDAGASARHGLDGVADAGAFLARLARFDPAAVVRLRSLDAAARTALWGRLPWGVLVSRTVTGPGPGDATVVAADLLAELDRAGAALPPRRDDRWRWPLPSVPGRVVETVPGGDLRRVAEAAAGTLRAAATHGVAGRAVGQRAIRDALLDHVAVVVTGDGGERVEVTQRLVQGVVRMGFLGAAGRDAPAEVQVRLANRWVGLVAPYGGVWWQKVADLLIKPSGDHPNG